MKKLFNLNAYSVKLVAVGILVLLPWTAIMAQNAVYRGLIVDDSREPLVGATVQVKGSSQGAVTDLDGKFIIGKMKPTATLVISYMGYDTKEVSVKNGDNLTIVLRSSTSVLNDVVVIGYGSIKKRDLTGSVSTINAKAIAERNPTNIFDALQGSSSGVQIISDSGTPGGDAYIRIRGTSTFGSGTTPLYVVDGVPTTSISFINPNDILSMEVMKDAASAAIYGSRSANGVIIITTKKGAKGKPQLNVQYEHSFNTLSHCIEQSTPVDWRYYLNTRYALTGLSKYLEIDSLKPFYNYDGNQKDLLFRTAAKDKLDLSFGGASDNISYYLSAGIYNEQGIVVKSNFKRYSLNFNGSYKPYKRFTIGTKIGLTYSDRKGINEGDVTANFYNWMPSWSPFDVNGNPMHNIGGKNSTYSVANLENHQYRNFYTNALIWSEYKFNKYLTLRSNLSGTYNTEKQYYFRPLSLGSKNDKATGRDVTLLNYNFLNENYLTYNHTIGDHQFTVMGGNSVQKWYYEHARLMGSEYTTDYIQTLNQATVFLASDNYSIKEVHSLASFFARATYNWKSRYIFALNIRYDGSSRFAEGNRWGAFPSTSAGWRLSDEPFMKWAKPALNDAKIRLSYGVTGNEDVGNYLSWATYQSNGIYDGVGGMTPGLTSSSLGWESTSQYDAGIDLNFLNDRLILSFDYYKKNTSDLLYETEVPKETGYNTVTQNVGAMENNGVEFSIKMNILKLKDWNWDLDFNISHNVSRIKTLADGVPFYTGRDGCVYVQENHKIGEFYGWKHNGIFAYDESNAFDDKWQQLTPVFENGKFSHYTLNGQTYTGDVNQKKRNGIVLKGGDVNWLDNPNGENMGVIEDDDRVFLGCAQPSAYGGLNSNLTWKSLSLYISFFYSLGGKFYDYQRYQRNRQSLDWTCPEPSVIDNMWVSQGDNAIYPTPDNRRKNLNSNLSPCDYWIEDGSFIKLRNVKLTYSLPTSICNSIGLNNILVYCYGNNLLTWTKYKGFDPEFGGDVLAFGIDTGRYPRKREIGLGINVGF